MMRVAEAAALAGSCHCGASRPAAELQARACQCSFCTRHGAMTVSDPAGRAVFDIERTALARYQFDTRTGGRYGLASTAGASALA